MHDMAYVSYEGSCVYSYTVIDITDETTRYARMLLLSAWLISYVASNVYISTQ